MSKPTPGPWRARSRLVAMLLPAWLLAATAVAQQLPEVSRRILLLPELQWTETASSWDYASHQTATDLARIMGGLRFGMTTEQVGQRLPARSAGFHWDDLPQAKEFSQDVRYVFMPMQGAGALVAPVKSCVGDPSYLELLFRDQTLFRVSWRFLPDAKCLDPCPASSDLYASFVGLPPTVAVSARYHTGHAEVVDVTDPNAGVLVAQRWHMQGQ